MSSETISQALQNLDAIKSGEDPRNIEEDDAIDMALMEVGQLYREHDIAEHLPRHKLSVGVARWKSRNGVCRYNCYLEEVEFGERVTGYVEKDGFHSIVINERIYEQGDIDGFMDTVRHELAHAVAYEKYGSSQKHNEKWGEIAEKLGANPKSCHGHKKNVDKPYLFACPNGCWSSGKSRRSKKVKKPWSNGRYCKDCDATPVSCDSHIDPTSLEEGEVAVESIGWSNKEEYRNC